MVKHDIDIIKSSGEMAKFSVEKLRNSLKASGADTTLIDKIVAQVLEELYRGISTREIYNRAFSMLKKKQSVYASKYKLKKAIYEFGPTGFPFERFISNVLSYSGYTTQVGTLVQGACVQHEVDVLASKNDTLNIIECKFHGDEGRKCNVKIPLYIHSRFLDIVKHIKSESVDKNKSTTGWVVTNTRFTADALTYGKCADLLLLSWDYPKGDGLKNRIDRLGLYPITVSTLLTNREKQFLLSREVVLCRQLLGDKFYLDHLGISDGRKEKILKEMSLLCQL